VLGPAAYGAASQAVGPLTVLVIGMALGRICSVTVVAQRRPAIALALTALAGASHAGAAFLLIPRFGPWGAAVASAAAQWVLGVGYYVVAARADAGVRLDRRVLVLVAGGAAALAYLGPALTAGPLLLRAGVALAGAGLASALALSLTRAAGVLSAGSRLDVLEGAPR
jgi:O-antigen/teichoic acid export membrane protein